jgi:hypothetical protein
MLRPPALLLTLLSLSGCPAERDDSDPATGPAGDPDTIPLAGECAMASDYGGFAVDALSDYSTVAGSVSDGVVPMAVLEEVAAEGDCRALRRNNPFCDPPCASDETCDFDGSCVPYPLTQDLGTVAIAGLAGPVSMDPVSPGYTYFDTSLGHPAYEPGVLIELTTGETPWGPVTMHGVGVHQLVPTLETLLVVEGHDLELGWDTPEGPLRSEVVLRINIDQHGATPISMHCIFEDDGAGVVPAALTDLLVNAGVTGFPSGSMVRRTVDSTPLGEAGCMDLVVSSTRNPDVRVDGYTPCQDDEDCPDGQTCNHALEICE